MKLIPVLALLLAAGNTATADNAIDLDCDALAARLVAQLHSDGLLREGADSQARAASIGRQLCQGAEQTARSQHAVESENTIRNWLLEDSSRKAGNKRLRNFKR